MRFDDPRSLLTLDDRQAIFDADPAETNGALAIRLHRPKYVISLARRDLRAGRWSCPVWFRACDICGAVFTARDRQVVRHADCDRVKHAEHWQDWYVRNREAKRQKNKQWQAEDSARLRESIQRSNRKKWEAKTDHDRAESLDKINAYSDESQLITRPEARQNRARWTDEEDAYVITHAAVPSRSVALVLGRTYYAVRARKITLRERGLLD